MASLVPELYCTDFERSMRFYVELLGFKVSYARPEERFAFLDRNGAQIMIEQPTTRTWLAGELSQPFGRGVNFEIDASDADELYTRCEAAGSRIFLALEEKWYRREDVQLGCRQFIVQDPDGYLLRFSKSIGSKPATSSALPTHVQLPDRHRAPLPVESSHRDVLFDVDGVLVRPPFGFRAYLERTHGITPQMTEPFFRGRFHACLTGTGDLADELAGHLDEWGWQGTTDDFIETWLREDDLPDLAMLALVTTTRQRGIRCHVASVQEKRRTSYLRDTMAFGKMFDEMLFSCDLGAAKPDQEFYLRAQKRLSKPPGELLLVDDSLACVEAARLAGWHAFHYLGPPDQSRLARTLAELAV